MQPLILSLTLICGLLAVGRFSLAQDADDSIESLARLVCETTSGTRRQILQVSRVPRLVQYFRSLAEGHKLRPCRDMYLESLEELERVVSVANDDACGEQKVKLIEDFHRKYVSKLSKHVRSQRRANRAPKMAKLLFMQYAAKVGSMCEQNAVSFIEKHQQPLGPEELARVEELRKFTDALGMSDLSKGFKGVYLFWNLVQSLGLDRDKKFARYLEPAGQFRLSVQMREARGVRGLQALCRARLRPAYSRSVLPVLRLVDLGYYPESRRLLADEPRMRPMFLAAQICETLLPVQVFEDPRLANDQFVALTKEEAAALAAPQQIEGLAETVQHVEVPPVSVAHLDELVGEDKAQASIDRIKANVASRSKVVRRMLRSLLRQLKARLGSSLGRSVLFRRGPNEQLEPVRHDGLDKIDEDQLLQPTEEELDEDAGGARLKRSFWSGFAIVSLYICYILYLYALTLIKMVLLFVPTIVLLVIGFSRDSDPALAAIDYLWKFGVDPLNPFPDDLRS